MASVVMANSFFWPECPLKFTIHTKQQLPQPLHNPIILILSPHGHEMLCFTIFKTTAVKWLSKRPKFRLLPIWTLHLETRGSIATKTQGTRVQNFSRRHSEVLGGCDPNRQTHTQTTNLVSHITTKETEILVMSS